MHTPNNPPSATGAHTGELPHYQNPHSNDSVLLSTTPLDTPAAIAFVSHPDAGGIDIFLGTTRAHTHPTHGQLLALDYDAYPEMALAQIRTMIATARTRWPILKCAIHHRTGTVPIGHPSVIIALSTPHRAEAFEACRHLIDTLKTLAPIWKKDIYQHAAAWHNDPDNGNLKQ